MDRILDKKLRKKYRSKNCELCGSINEVSGHHIKTKGSGGWDIEENLIALCFDCHVLIHNEGINDMIGIYPHLEEILYSKNWEKIDFFGRFKWLHKNIIM